MILNCTYCGNPFTHTSTAGRPPGMCSPACKSRSRTDPMRICRTCGSTFHKGDTTLPFHCSEECRSATRMQCLHCTGNLPGSDSKFCSEKCVLDHYPDRTCQQCNKPITTVHGPPWTRAPRFCSQDCRTTKALQEDKVSPFVRQEALVLARAVTYLPTPLWTLPHRGWFRPYRIPHQLAPELPMCTAKVSSSIEWWNYFLSQEDHPPLWVAHLGRTGWGGADTPAGCLPMYQCWPWITTPARQHVETQTVFAYWSVAEQAAGSRRNLESKKDRIRNKVMEFLHEDWHQNSYYVGKDGRSSQFVNDLVNYYSACAPPADELCYTPEELTSLNSDEYHEFYTSWESKRKRYKKYTQHWKDDPAPPTDRLHDMIDEILDTERSKR